MKKCPKCGRESDDSFKYCPFDSTSLGKTCPTCGRQWEESYEFCPVDATPLSEQTQQAPPDAEPPTVTAAETMDSAAPISRRRSFTAKQVAGLCVAGTLLGFAVALGVVLWSGSESQTYRQDSPTTVQSEKQLLVPSEEPAGEILSSPPAKPQPQKMSPGEIASIGSGGVVVVENYGEDGQKQGQGSGFVFSSERVDTGAISYNESIILTNYHVIRGASRVTIRTADRNSHEAQSVLAFDPDRDIAALKVGVHGLPTLPLADSDGVKTGDEVVAIGAPLGLENTLSDGLISSIRDSGRLRVFQTSTPISPGSSGGPLFNDYGQVVGLAVASIREGQNLNFAIPINYVKQMLESASPISFAEMLSRTKVRQTITAQTYSVPPKREIRIPLEVPRSGGHLEASFSVSGTMRKVIVVGLFAAANSGRGGSPWPPRRVTGSGAINTHLGPGRYELVFSNDHVLLSKSVTASVYLTYFR